ncbi:MAG TPA: DegT/DnrJ/EryC1/StrS family aminotransferase, partial [Blastocatellia bacterium]
HAYPLSELQATVLLPQLERLDERNRERASNVSKLAQSLKAVSGLRPLDNRGAPVSPGYYKLGFQYDPNEFDGLSRDMFAQAARSEGIEFNAGFRALHLCRSSRRFRKAGELAVAAVADANMLTLHHPALLAGDEAIDQIARAVTKIRAWAGPIKNAMTRQRS